MDYNNMKKGDLCLVTGITGYLASWVGKYLLQDGFRVRGTMRNINDSKKVKMIKENLPGIELVEADLQKEKGWKEAVEGCKWVFHVASPQAKKTEKNLIASATQGTKYALQASFQSNTVKKVVVTSSESAIIFGHPSTKTTFTENDWTNPKNISEYFRSKTLAEKIAWDMVQNKVQNPNNVKLSTINPVFIFGPSCLPNVSFTQGWIKKIAEGKEPMQPDMSADVVDVRDCARMHITIMDKKETNGNRHFSIGARGKFVDLPTAIRHNFSHLGFAPSSKVMPKYMMWIGKLFSKEAASAYPLTGKTIRRESIHTDVYTYQHTNFDTIIKETVEDLLAKNALVSKV
ncbi:NAD-dependent epimerase/dehydratase family protein [Shimazuella kribbensis]|uniref:NAD-dependent epimerase/dehydratase family protein n=1 Tax=Shimazuella kribbensis TaxID=139808 RepID=UPI0003FCA004|nr:NAD-dependent epimerase/dehydratase family protein [Shimazuella kribbensis]